MTVNEILKLNKAERIFLWKSTIEKVGMYFKQAPCYGAYIHAGVSYFFAASSELVTSDLIFIVNHAITPFKDNDPLCRPKNKLWKKYLDSPPGLEREKAYIKAHNRDLDLILEDSELKKALKKCKSQTTKEAKIALAYYEALIGAAYETEKRYDHGGDEFFALSGGVDKFINAFNKNHVTPFTEKTVALFKDAANISVFESMGGNISENEIYALKSVNTLIKLKKVLEGKTIEEFLKLCKEVFTGHSLFGRIRNLIVKLFAPKKTANIL